MRAYSMPNICLLLLGVVLSLDLCYISKVVPSSYHRKQSYNNGNNQQHHFLPRYLSFMPSISMVSAQVIDIKKLGVMYESYCVLLSNKEMKCWGHGGNGRLGSGSTNDIGDTADEMGINLPSIQLGAGFEIEDAAFGDYHVCAISSKNQVKCFGDGTSGKLGIGNTEHLGDQPNEMGDNLPYAVLGTDSFPKSIHCGGAYTCVVFQNNKAKCFGSSFSGSHGQGTSTEFGSTLDTIGDNIPYIQLGIGRRVKSFFANYVSWTNCVIMDNDDVKCWGSNLYGQLGYGDTENRGDDLNEMGDNLPSIDFGAGRKAVWINLGRFSTCALLTTNELVCWGRGDDGEIALGEIRNVGDEPGEMGLNLPSPNLGKGRRVILTDGGEEHRCFLLDNNDFKCTGKGYGSTGNYWDSDVGATNDTVGDFLPAINWGTNLPITHIGAGLCSNCVVFIRHYIKCFGCGMNGRLGIGNLNGYALKDMEKETLPFVDIGLPSLAPTSVPTLHPTPFPTVAPTTSLPTTTPTSSPTDFQQKNPPLYYFLVIGLPLLLLIVFGMVLGKTSRERKLIISIGLSLFSVATDVTYICKAVWYSKTLLGLSIALIFMPPIGFVWMVIKLSKVHPFKIMNYAPDSPNELYKVALIFLAFLTDELIVILMAIFLSLMFYPIIFALVTLKLIGISNCREWIISKIDALINISEYDDPRNFSIEDDDGLILNIAMFSCVMLDNIPQLIIFAYNHKLSSPEDPEGTFVLAITITSLCIANTIIPFMYHLITGKRILEILNNDRLISKTNVSNHTSNTPSSDNNNTKNSNNSNNSNDKQNDQPSPNGINSFNTKNETGKEENEMQTPKLEEANQYALSQA